MSQIFLISFYIPEMILARMSRVLETYPPTEFPKLYPKPIEHYRIGQWAFKVISRSILVLGILILLVIATVVDHSTFADDGYISEAFPAVYGIIQFLPFLFLEFSEFSQLKLMRKANSASTRTAELRPRRFFQFVSPKVFGLAVGLFIATIFVDLYVHDFLIQWGHDTVERAVLLTATNIFMACVGAWNLYGRKQNPHQAHGDRARQTKVHLNSMLYASMAMSVYFMTAAADDAFDLDFLDAILLSLYFQVIVVVSIGHVLRSLKLEDINFDVYKKDAAVT
jgi:hypothetical protein